MANPPPLPGRSDNGPPSLPSTAGNADDWTASLRAMGFRDDPEAPIRSGLNLRGTIDGHLVRIHASRRTRTRYSGEVRRSTYHGHRIEITVTTAVMTRCALSHPANALERWAARTNRWFGAREVAEKGAVCDFLTVWATEPIWVKSFLNRSDVEEKIEILIPASDLPPNVGLKWWPGFLTYSRRIDIKRINAETMALRVLSLVQLAVLAEASPPAIEVSLNRWERWSLKQPVHAGCLVVAAVFAIFILLGLVFSAILIGLSVVLSR